jgi:DNA recombination protein RmuC
MNGLLLGIIVVLALLVLWQILQAVWTRREQTQLGEVRSSVQQLAGQTQNVTQQMGQLIQQVAQQLANVNASLQKGVTDSAQIAAKAQEAVSGELRSSQALLSRIQQQLGEFQELGRGMSQATQTLQNVLGGAKTRGILGEVTLERMLEDTLPGKLFVMQYRFSTGEVADAVVKFDDKLLVIDSKFPLDDYRRLETGGEEARRSFFQAVRGHADSIARKYILPNEGTLDIAFMFVPSESVYYELLRTEDAKGARLDEYCRTKRVIPTSPNSLYSYLSVVMMAMRGMQIAENAKRLLEGLAGLQRQLATLHEVHERLGTHLRNAQQNYAETERRLERAEATLEQMAQGSLPEAPPFAEREAQSKDLL